MHGNFYGPFIIFSHDVNKMHHHVSETARLEFTHLGAAKEKIKNHLSSCEMLKGSGCV